MKVLAGLPQDDAAFLHSYSTRNDCISHELRPDVPFSLVCMYCDDGMQIDSYEQAIAEGWSDISYEPHMPMANYLGICPVCREAEEKLTKPADPE